MNITRQRIAIIGGTGLVGSAVTKELLPYRPQAVLVFARKDEHSNEAVRTLRSAAKRVPIQFVWGNLLREAMSARHEGTTLYKSLVRFHPDIIVDATNTATIHVGGPSIHRLRLYYDLLFKAFRALSQGNGQQRVTLFLKIGTTGTGGMGLDIPFSHYRISEHLLMEKAMLAGAQTAYLLLASRTAGMPTIKEIKPASALFDPAIASQAIGNTSIPVFKGGESGNYSIEEFATLTDIRNMGFLSSHALARIVLREIRTNRTGFDCIAALNASLPTATPVSERLRERLLRKARCMHTEGSFAALATGALGPVRISAMLVEAWIIRSIAPTLVKLKRSSDAKLSARAFENIRTIPHFAATLRRLHLKLLRTDSPHRDFGHIDLRTWKMGWWREQISLYTKEHRTSDMPYPGDLVGWILSHESQKQEAVNRLSFLEKEIRE